MKYQRHNPRGFTLVELLVVIAIIATLAGIATPMILNARKAGDRTQAVSNAKQVGLSLFDFDQEFGSFPDDDTAEEVVEQTGTDLNLSGGTANDYFRQLIAFGMQSEEIFYAKVPGTKKPDNVITGTEALDEGEVGFGYVMLDETTGQSTAGNPGRPVIVAPLLDASTNWEFDPNPFDNKAVILRLDNSVQIPSINQRTNKVSVGGGNNLEDTGEDTVWGTNTTPALQPPNLRGG